ASNIRRKATHPVRIVDALVTAAVVMSPLMLANACRAENGDIFFTGATLPAIMRATAPCFTPQTIVAPVSGTTYAPLSIDRIHQKVYSGISGDTAVHGIGRAYLDGSAMESVLTV